MELPHPLFRFFLEGLGRGGEVRVLVAEELVGNLPGEEHPDVRVLVNGLAHQIHADAGPDGGDVVGAQQGHHPGQGLEHVLPGDHHLVVVGPDKFRRFPGVFQVDGVHVHADGKGLNGFFQELGRHGAHQGGIQAAAEEEPQGHVGIQPLGNAGSELFPDVPADGVQAVVTHLFHLGHVPVADELLPVVVVPRREGDDLLAQAHQVLGLAGKEHLPSVIFPVEQGPDADGVPGGDELAGLAVIEDHGKFRVQLCKHLKTVFPVQGQQDFAVGAALEGVALLLQLLFHGPEPVDFPVAHQEIPVPAKGLHPFRLGAHNGQPVKCQQPLPRVDNPGIVRPPGTGPRKALPEFFQRHPLAAISHNGAHKFKHQPSQFLFHVLYSPAPPSQRDADAEKPSGFWPKRLTAMKKARGGAPKGLGFRPCRSQRTPKSRSP